MFLKVHLCRITRMTNVKYFINIDSKSKFLIISFGIRDNELNFFLIVTSERVNNNIDDSMSDV